MAISTSKPSEMQFTYVGSRLEKQCFYFVGHRQAVRNLISIAPAINQRVDKLFLPVVQIAKLLAKEVAQRERQNASLGTSGSCLSVVFLFLFLLRSDRWLDNSLVRRRIDSFFLWLICSWTRVVLDFAHIRIFATSIMPGRALQLGRT
jgi:hypothetical protein